MLYHYVDPILFFTTTLVLYSRKYYKVGQQLLQSEQLLVLQSGVAFLLQSGARFITKWGRYYKVGQNYYKVGQVLQSGASITKWGITDIKLLISHDS